MYFAKHASMPAPRPVCRMRDLPVLPRDCPGRRVSRAHRRIVPSRMVVRMWRGQTCTFFGLSSCATLLLSLALAKR